VGDEMEKIIDLTYDISEGMTTFNAPWHPLVSIKQMGRIGMEGRETRKISFGTHTGTHVDAPLHFIKNGISIDEIPLSKLVGNITMIDLSSLKENTPITKEMLVKLPISKKTLFKFGWGKFWGTNKFYSDYPYFTKEAAEFLVSKNVELIAYDIPSPDNSYARIILVEYLANLDKVDLADDWKIVVTPLKIKNADGSPARVFIYK